MATECKLYWRQTAWRHRCCHAHPLTPNPVNQHPSIPASQYPSILASRLLFCVWPSWTLTHATRRISRRPGAGRRPRPLPLRDPMASRWLATKVIAYPPERSSRLFVLSDFAGDFQSAGEITVAEGGRNRGSLTLVDFMRCLHWQRIMRIEKPRFCCQRVVWVFRIPIPALLHSCNPAILHMQRDSEIWDSVSRAGLTAPWSRIRPAFSTCLDFKLLGTLVLTFQL